MISKLSISYSSREARELLFVECKNSARKEGALLLRWSNQSLQLFSASNEEFDTNTNACKLENDAIFCTKETRVIFILDTSEASGN